MTFNDIYVKLEQSNAAQYSIFFLERIKTKNQVSYNVIKSKRTNKMGKSLRDDALQITRNIKSRTILSYNDELSQKRGKIQEIQATSVPNFNAITASCKMVTANSVRNAEDLSKNLWGYVIKVDMDDTIIYFFKKYTPSSLIDARKAFYQIKGATITPLKKKNTFSLDKYYDAILMRTLGDSPSTTPLYIINRVEFEEFFSYKEYYIKYNEENKNSLAKSGRLDDVDAFVKRCSKNFLYSLRLSRILQNKKYLNIDIQELSEILINNNSDVKVVNGMIKYDTKHAEEILDLLDDSYLFSKVTKTNYKSNGKVEL
jgi:hypothetical protein